MPTELTIIFERDDAGWWIATIPEVPGAFSQGATKDEARENVLDALTESWHQPTASIKQNSVESKQFAGHR